MRRQFEYQQDMDALRFTDSQKERLTEAVLARAEAPARRRPLGKMAVIAACLAAVLTVSAAGTGVLKSAVDVFSPLFGGAVAQTEIIDRIGRPIGAGDSDSGVTVTADAIMGDAYNVAVIYTFSRDDGESFLPEGREVRELMVDSTSGLHRMNGGAHGVAYFFDADPEDGAVQYIECLSSTVPMGEAGAEKIVQGNASADFRNVECYNPETDRYESLYSGHWHFRFEASYEDISVQLAGGETFTQDGIGFTLQTVSVSPLGIFVGYTADREPVWSDSRESGRMDPADEREADRFMGNIALLLTKTDGTVLEIETGGSIIPEDGVTRCTKGDVFPEIIPLEDIASVSVGGVEYPVSAE